MNYIIEESIALEILNYLANRPYIEVAELVKKLQALPKETAEED